ncbi:MAG: hypothetical protein ACI4TI_02340 [Christensenellales bacterium]
MTKYKMLWKNYLISHIMRIVLGINTWKESFTDNEWLGIILGWLIYIIVIVCASPITFIVSVFYTIKTIIFFRRKIKENNQVFIEKALKYNIIKELKGKVEDE